MHQQPRYAIRCSTEEQARECIESIRQELDETKERLEKHISRFEADKRLPIVLCKFGNNIVCNVGESMNKRPEDNGYTIINYDEAISLGLLGEGRVCKSCLGKKQNSVYKGDKVLQPDFIGDGRYLLEGEGITMVDCSRCKGTGLEPEFIPEEELQKVEPVKYEQVCKYKGGHEIYSKGDDNCFCRQCGKKGTRNELRLDFNVEPVKESPSEDIVEKIDKTKSSDDIWYALEEVVDKVNEIIEVVNKYLSSK